MTHVIEGLNFKVLFDCNGGSRKRPVAAVCGESCSSGPSTPTSSPPCYLRGGLPAAAEHCDLNAVRRTRENASEAKRNISRKLTRPSWRSPTRSQGLLRNAVGADGPCRSRGDETLQKGRAGGGLLWPSVRGVSPRAAPEPGLESKDFIRKVQETRQRVGR